MLSNSVLIEHLLYANSVLDDADPKTYNRARETLERKWEREVVRNEDNEGTTDELYTQSV